MFTKPKDWKTLTTEVVDAVKTGSFYLNIKADDNTWVHAASRTAITTPVRPPYVRQMLEDIAARAPFTQAYEVDTKDWEKGLSQLHYDGFRSLDWGIVHFAGELGDTQQFFYVQMDDPAQIAQFNSDFHGTAFKPRRTR